jgi:S-adenosylmethionine hydrolase
VGPDNGLFTFVLESDFQAWELRNPRLSLPNPGTTFHGRDIFAPAAAHAAVGVAGSDFGPPVADPVYLPLPRLESLSPGVLRGEVLHADRFGNLLTSLGRFERLEKNIMAFKPWLAEAAGRSWQYSLPVAASNFQTELARVYLSSGRSLAWVNTFADVPAGECAVLVGSAGLLEIVANNQSAADRMGLRSGDTITLQIETQN